MAYDKLKSDERSGYEQRAREIIYEGLEPGYLEHDKMLGILARALYKVDQLKLAGERT